MAYDELEELSEDLEGDEFDDLIEGYDSEEGFSEDFEEDFEDLAEAAMEGDEDAEDEFLGALAGLAAKALPSIAGAVVPKVLKFGKKLFRKKSRRLVRMAPRIVKKATRIIARKPRAYRRRPANVGLVLNRVTREYVKQR